MNVSRPPSPSANSTSLQLARHAGSITLATAGSRVLGYLRDMLIAHRFGAGMEADAFYVAYRLPNLLRRLLGEGALSASFVPVFTEYLETKSREEARRLVNGMFASLAVVLAAVVAAGVLFTPAVVRVVAPGFSSSPEKLALTVTLTRVLFPFLAAVGFAALVLGVLNSLHRFIVPALAPCALSLSEIGFLLAVCPLMSSPILGLALGALLGGAAQLAVQLPPLWKEGFSLSWTAPFRHPGVRRVSRLMLPAVGGLSIDQVNAFVDTICASWLPEGSVTALYYSNRVMQLPLALFGISVATVVLPVMSAQAARRDRGEMIQSFGSSLRLGLFLTLPASVGLMILAGPIIRLLFQHGEFGGAAAGITAQALVFFAAGLFAYSAVKVVAGTFYALQDTATPVKAAAAAMLANAAMNLAIVFIPLLKQNLGVGGLALATALSATMNLVMLFWILRRRMGRLGGRAILLGGVRMAGACAIMALVVWWVAFRLLPGPPLLQVGAAMTAGVAVYFGASAILRIEERKTVWAIISRAEAAE